MAQFLGTTEHPITKGRISLPAKHRKGLPDDLVLVEGPDDELNRFPSLRVWSEKDYLRYIDLVIEKLGGEDPTNLELDDERTRLAGAAEPVSVDSAGRILIPSNMRDHAQLGAKALVVGAIDHIEIWDPQVLASKKSKYPTRTFKRASQPEQ